MQAKVVALVNDTYLGRAQTIETHPSGAQRTYRWTSTGSGAGGAFGLPTRGPGDWDQLAEDARDLCAIKQYRVKRQDYPYVADSDDYSNPRAVLPLYICDGGNVLRIKYFNLGVLAPHVSPPYAECSLRVATAYGYKRRSSAPPVAVSIDVTDRLEAFIRYTSMGDDTICVQAIELHATHGYAETLSHMARNAPPKTV